MLVPVVMAVGKHKSNYAVIVSTSRYWFNYRHNVQVVLEYIFDHPIYCAARFIKHYINPFYCYSNALSIYHSVKRMGILTQILF